MAERELPPSPAPRARGTQHTEEPILLQHQRPRHGRRVSGVRGIPRIKNYSPVCALRSLLDQSVDPNLEKYPWDKSLDDLDEEYADEKPWED